MSEPNKNTRRSISIEQIKEAYQDHPTMQRVNAFKEELKQEKAQDKVFCQSIKEQTTRKSD